MTSTQLPAQLVRPPAQLQKPPEHSRPGSQATPQAPQWVVLVARATQLLPQSCRPSAQLLAQVPSEHTVPDGQTLPQVPQLLPSEVVCTHPVGHAVVPTWH
jgi:hypothetical protein